IRTGPRGALGGSAGEDHVTAGVERLVVVAGLPDHATWQPVRPGACTSPAFPRKRKQGGNGGLWPATRSSMIVGFRCPTTISGQARPVCGTPSTVHSIPSTRRPAIPFPVVIAGRGRSSHSHPRNCRESECRKTDNPAPPAEKERHAFGDSGPDLRHGTGRRGPPGRTGHIRRTAGETASLPKRAERYRSIRVAVASSSLLRS